VSRRPALLLTIFLALSAACAPSLYGTDDDLTITARVKTVLLNDRDLGAMRIDVETLKGVVTLSGSLKTADERAKAIALARKVKGVRDVKVAEP
jgi:osmotically-inducible protein OsmY